MVSRLEIEKRKTRVRNKLKKSSSDRMRLSIFRSNKEIYAQVIDDIKGIAYCVGSTGKIIFKPWFKY